MFIFSSHQANRLIYSLFLWPLCNCSVDGPLWSCFATESSVECMASADQRCHSLNFNSVNTAFQEGKFKLQKLLTIIYFFCLFLSSLLSVKCSELWVRKVSPHTNPPKAPFAAALWLLKCPPFKEGGQDFLNFVLSNGCTGTHWEAPVLRIIFLGMCTLAQAEDVTILLAALAPLAAAEEDGVGFISYWPYIHYQRHRPKNPEEPLL